MKEIFSKLYANIKAGRDAILVTIIDEAGSSPRGRGAQMVVTAEGLQCGTIGGGAVEKVSIEHAVELTREKKSDVREYALRDEKKSDLGMGCGGDVSVLFQFVDAADKAWEELCNKVLGMIEERQPGWFVQYTDGSMPAVSDEICTEENSFSMRIPVGERVYLFGGGHCSIALAPILHSVGFRVIVMDNREEFVTEERFPMAERRICGDYKEIDKYLDITADDYVVVMTTGHVFDYDVEYHALQGDCTYIGVIGSMKKTAIVNDKLRNAGISEEKIASVHAPIGTNIKASTPAEIAISIAGEMIMVRATEREKAGAISRNCPV